GGAGRRGVGPPAGPGRRWNRVPEKRPGLEAVQPVSPEAGPAPIVVKPERGQKLQPHHAETPVVLGPTTTPAAVGIEHAGELVVGGVDRSDRPEGRRLSSRD